MIKTATNASIQYSILFFTIALGFDDAVVCRMVDFHPWQYWHFEENQKLSRIVKGAHHDKGHNVWKFIGLNLL